MDNIFYSSSLLEFQRYRFWEMWNEFICFGKAGLHFIWRSVSTSDPPKGGHRRYASPKSMPSEINWRMSPKSLRVFRRTLFSSFMSSSLQLMINFSWKVCNFNRSLCWERDKTFSVSQNLLNEMRLQSIDWPNHLRICFELASNTQIFLIVC